MQKDIRWEDFFAHNHRYADIINGIGCKGFSVVQESDLKEAETKSGLKNRDASRKVAFGANFALIGIENQENLDYKLPLRTMAYDLKNYERQAAEIRRKVREESVSTEPGEYLYGFLKDSKLYPSITFVLYSGEKEWDGARGLHEILDFSGIPKSLREMASDYRINIIDIRRLEDTSVFRTDVKQVFDFIRCSKDKKALLELITNDKSFMDMEEDALEVMALYSNVTGLLRQKIYEKREKIKEGGDNVSDAILDLMEDSRMEGKEEGRKEGRKEGRTDLINNFLSNGGSKEDAIRLLGVTEEDVTVAERCLVKMS